jgi:hypothetical protein
MPDGFEFKFGDDEAIVDQRLIAGTGADANAISFSGIQPQNLAKLTQPTSRTGSSRAGTPAPATSRSTSRSRCSRTRSCGRR